MAKTGFGSSKPKSPKKGVGFGGASENDDRFGSTKGSAGKMGDGPGGYAPKVMKGTSGTGGKKKGRAMAPPA